MFKQRAEQSAQINNTRSSFFRDVFSFFFILSFSSYPVHEKKKDIVTRVERKRRLLDYGSFYNLISGHFMT